MFACFVNKKHVENQSGPPSLLKCDENSSDVVPRSVHFNDNHFDDKSSENGVKLIAGKKITAIFEV